MHLNLVRTYTDKHGLKDLCKELLDKDLNKTQQSSDWSAKELSSNQLKYASNDVIFLIELKQILQSMLKEKVDIIITKIIYFSLDQSRTRFFRME